MSLPWTEVNESAPAEVAAVLRLEYSPRGARKRCCPFCGGRNFSPLKRAFDCYSGCGGKAYSNVDTAAAHWQTTAIDACRRLAEELGIAVFDSDPPWTEVAAAASPDVAAVLGLTRAAGEWLWNCPDCGGAGALRSYQRKWRCNNLPCAQDERRGWRGHVDLAMAVWQTTPVDACFRLAHALRGAAATPAPAPALVREPRVPEESPRAKALAALLTRPGTRQPGEFYRLLLRHLRLGALGRGELSRRQIDVRQAEAYGFRSTEPGEWRSRVLPFMAAFSDDELTAAGFPPKFPGRPHADRRPCGPAMDALPCWSSPSMTATGSRGSDSAISAIRTRRAAPGTSHPSTSRRRCRSTWRRSPPARTRSSPSRES